VDFGVGYFPTHDAIGPGEIARLVEARGQESLFFAEHTHIPASRETPYPGGGDLPRKYSHTHDLFVALTAAAVATSSLRVGRHLSGYRARPHCHGQGGRFDRPPFRWAV
jgi:alkanesulfonate monooxygenase SsuD/methylene tetrahydromethanopterin reductase-like flavin-dependent oxidoreductase (luciferase family)